ncbi:MAG: hypothetical protein HKN25_16975 [Pyrinomonadaceae bacterium]|nr:hypothetical protein [Pyrinomonadaceae bacterium]
MNTSPKIVKKSAVEDLGPVSFPEFRIDQPDLGKVLDFVVPDIEEIQLEEQNTSLADPGPDAGGSIDASQITEIEEAAREKAAQEIQQKIDEEVDIRIRDIRNSLSEAIGSLASSKEDISRQTESELVRLAIKIAEKIVGREVIVDETIALEMTKRTLKQIDSRALAEIHLSPADFEFVQEKHGEIGFHGSLKLIEDPAISNGGCLVHTETGDFDARIESQLEEIIEGLLDP